MDPIAVEGGTLYSMLKGKESAAGKKIVSYRVKYPLTFNADSTKIATWGILKFLNSRLRKLQINIPYLALDAGSH